MKSFHEWYMEREPLNEAAKKSEKKADKKSDKKKDEKKGQSPSSNRIKGFNELVNSLKKFFQDFDLETRKYCWNKINTVKGKALVEKILRNPRSPISNSSFYTL